VVGAAAGLVAGLASLTASVTAPEPAAAESCSIGSPSGAFAGVVESSPYDARVWRLYQAFFLREPETDGFAYWLGQYRAGQTLEAIAYNFERSDEFSARYGSLSNADFLHLVYRNVMCRTPDLDGFNYWLDRLDRGVVNRGQVMVLFSESVEYQYHTGTHWGVFTGPDQATLANEGYEIRSIPGGQVVVADYSRVDFRASHGRCSIASINGNWFHNPDQPNPTPIGFAVIDGQQLSGAVNQDDRGVFGERYRPNGPDEERTYAYDNVSLSLNSNLEAKPDRVLESWRMWLPADGQAPPPVDNPSEWRWAAAGVPLIVRGQVWDAWPSIPTNSYTFYTTRHSFVAFDKDTGLLAFGSTTGMNAGGIISWAQQNGYDDLIKFDGGGSVEFNVGGQTRVAGTSRDVPLWLGIGC
jgi:hypothetical protein